MGNTIPRWVWEAVAVLALLAAGWFSLHVWGDSRYEAGYSAAQADYATQAAQQERKNRTSEQLLNDRLARASDANQALQQQLDANAADAAGTIGALRLQLDGIARAVRDGAADTGTSSAIRGKTTAQAIGVLADLLSESYRRGAIRADYADRAAAAGQLCTVQYEELRKLINGQNQAAEAEAAH